MMTSIGPLLSYNPSFGRGVSRQPARRSAWSASVRSSGKANGRRREASDHEKRGAHFMIQNIPDGVDSKFRLVLLIARRAEQLMRGARPKIEPDRPTKPTRLAAEEFEENRVRWDYGAEGGVLEDGESTEAETEEETAEEEAAV